MSWPGMPSALQLPLLNSKKRAQNSEGSMIGSAKGWELSARVGEQTNVERLTLDMESTEESGREKLWFEFGNETRRQGWGRKEASILVN